ncbi:hypothetical protein [Actinoplanes siamensis]|uniref:Uncharacterized protein n=1 Tax=Actinoplanes siamensis TaxID=1223317 RepID=A0A919NFV2_9ACTN|nr:hypothetical protein [Actinoplanes siamensis]GIF09929.1 hypothetical protein Asi03nite_74670 [Actinoplanes siamensis]
MPLVSSSLIDLRPSHGTFTLRDVDADAGVGASKAIKRAWEEVAASTGYEVWVVRAQDMLLVAVEVQTWDSVPDEPPSGTDWLGPVILPLRCATGDLILSDDARCLDDIVAPAGPGNYTVQVFYAGREEAVAAYQAIAETIGKLPVPKAIAYIDENLRGVERYLLRLYPGRPGREP